MDLLVYYQKTKKTMMDSQMEQQMGMGMRPSNKKIHEILKESCNIAITTVKSIMKQIK